VLSPRSETLLKKKCSKITKAPPLIARTFNQLIQDREGNRDRDSPRRLLLRGQAILLRWIRIHGSSMG
jgi:hypothetical protein